jgi:hypothetical protein
MLNVAGSGKFSSDRTIAQYAAQIWNAKPCPVPWKGSAPMTISPLAGKPEPKDMLIDPDLFSSKPSGSGDNAITAARGVRSGKLSAFERSALNQALAKALASEMPAR